MAKSVQIHGTNMMDIKQIGDFTMQINPWNGFTLPNIYVDYFPPNWLTCALLHTSSIFFHCDELAVENDFLQIGYKFLSRAVRKAMLHSTAFTFCVVLPRRVNNRDSLTITRILKYLI